MNRCENSYIRTFTGRKFWPLCPHAEDVDILDIAHALSMTCRWGGHCRKFYSVAQHSVLCAAIAPNDAIGRVMMLHDASEAYMTDLPRPAKHGIPEFKIAETRLMAVIAGRFGIAWPMCDVAHEIDNRMLATEAKWLFEGRDSFDGERYGGLKFDPWSPARAETCFLNHFAYFFP